MKTAILRNATLALLVVATAARAESAGSERNAQGLLAAEPGAQRAQRVNRVDGVAAVVGALTPGPAALVILHSDVELRARMAMLRQSDVRTALGPLPEGVLSASLKELLGEALIAVESARLNMAEPAPGALADQRTQLVGTPSWPTPARELLDALGVNERELSAWAERRAVVDAFLQANLEGTLDVSDEELAKAFANEAHPFQGEPYAQAQPRFRLWYSQRKLQQAVERWIVSLSQRTPHRVLARY
jgi:hypothetical protein